MVVFIYPLNGPKRIYLSVRTKVKLDRLFIFIIPPNEVNFKLSVEKLVNKFIK